MEPVLTETQYSEMRKYNSRARIEIEEITEK